MALASLTVSPWTSPERGKDERAGLAHHRPRLVGPLPAEDARLGIASGELRPNRAVADIGRDDAGAASGFREQKRALLPGDAPNEQKIAAGRLLLWS
jgi:hypothetical protein